MKRLLTLEPALVKAMVGFVVLVGSVIGINLAPIGQGTETIVLAFLGLVPLVVGWWTRGSVTPNALIVERQEGGKVVAGPANELIPDGERVRLLGSRSFRRGSSPDA